MSYEQQIDDSVSQVRAAESIPRSLALIKVENDSIMAAAAAHKRDLPAILGELNEQLAAFPAFASKTIYTKPVGKDNRGVMKFASDLSIRAAEAMAEAYGYNRVATSCEATDDPNVWQLSASFTDYAKCRVWTVSTPLSRKYTNRDGDVKTHREDRFFDVVVKARLSILARDAILRGVNAGLKAEFKEKAQRLMGEALTDEAVEKLIGAWASKDVSLDMIEDLLGRTKANWNVGHRTRLLELWQAIEDGETTVAQAFAPDDDPPVREDRSPESIVGENAAAPEPEPEPEAPAEEPEGDGPPPAQAVTPAQKGAFTKLCKKPGMAEAARTWLTKQFDASTNFNDLDEETAQMLLDDLSQG